jgi:hypothetical protein
VDEHEAQKIRRRMRQHDAKEAAERLYSICGDGQLSGDERGGTILFSREAVNAI